MSLHDVKFIMDCEAFILPGKTIIRDIAIYSYSKNKLFCREVKVSDVLYEDLTSTDLKTIHFCRKRIHGKHFINKIPGCDDASKWLDQKELSDFIRRIHECCGGGFVGYKGGHIEKDILTKLSIPSCDIGTFSSIDFKPKHFCFFHSYNEKKPPHCSVCDVISYRKAVNKCLAKEIKSN